MSSKRFGTTNKLQAFHPHGGLLLRPADNSPFTRKINPVSSNGSVIGSAPYSVTSTVQSSYDDYEDDFSDEEDEDLEEDYAEDDESSVVTAAGGKST